MDGVGGFHGDFAEGRVGVDRLAEFGGGHLQVHRGGGFGNQVGGMRPDDMDAKNPVGVLVGDDLAETGSFADGHGLAKAGEGEFADMGFNILLGALFGGEADRADFREGEDAARHQVIAEGVVLAGGVVGGADAHGAGNVGQLDPAGDIADGVDSGNAGPAMVVDGDEALGIGLDAGGGQVEFGGDRLAADRNQQVIGHDNGVADIAGDPGRGRGDIGQRLAGVDLDAEFLHLGGHGARHFLVEGGQDAVEHFDDRHLGPQPGEQAGEFTADDPATQHQQAGRDRLGRQHSSRIQDPLGFRNEPGHQRRGAGGDDDLVGFDDLCLAVRRDGDLAPALEGGSASEEGDLVGLDQLGDAVAQLGDDIVLALLHRGEIGHGRAGGLDAEAGRRLDHVQDFSAGQQRLGRDAAPVEAGAAEKFLLDQRDLRAILRRPDRGHIAARSSANHGDVEFFHFGESLGEGTRHKALGTRVMFEKT